MLITRPSQLIMKGEKMTELESESRRVFTRIASPGLLRYNPSGPNDPLFAAGAKISIAVFKPGAHTSGMIAEILG